MKIDSWHSEACFASIVKEFLRTCGGWVTLLSVVGLLLQRYTPNGAQHTKTNITNNSLMSPEIFNILCKWCAIFRYLLASSLEHDLKINTFYSLHAREAVFGATYKVYSMIAVDAFVFTRAHG